MIGSGLRGSSAPSRYAAAFQTPGGVHVDEILQCIQPYLTALKDFLTSLSLVVAGVVAIAGLRTWRRQLKGTTEYELARRVVKAAYRLRDAIDKLRSPLITAAETASALKETGIEITAKDPNPHAAQSYAVYQVRWKPIADAFHDLELEALEAEALWGRTVRDTIMDLRRSVNKLFSALDLILRQESNPDAGILDRPTREAFEKIIYRMSEKQEDDPYSLDLLNRIAAIEELMKPHLSR